MIKIVCDKCGRETLLKDPGCIHRSKIRYEEYDLCTFCALEIKSFINQKEEPQTEREGE